MTIVAIRERGDSGPDFLHVLKDAAMDGLLLEGAIESLGHTVGLRLGDEGKARGDAPEADLVEEVVSSVLRAVIQAQPQPTPGIRAGGAEFRTWAIGCKAAQRLPILTAWVLTQQASK